MKKKAKLPQKSRDVPATVGLVLEVRDEMKAEFRGLENKLESHDKRFGSIDAKFDSIDARFDSIDARFDSLESRMDSRFKEQDAKIEKVLVAVHRTQAIVEEQRFENRVMLEALNGFVQRMDRIEARQDEHDTTLRSLIRSRDS